MSRLFISHSSADRRFVEDELIGLLRALGFDVWYGPDDVKKAEHWERAIEANLKASAWFLLVMSPNSAKSEWVKNELHWAMEKRPGRIIPVLMGDCKADSFHIGLPRIQHVDFRSDPCKAREALIKLLVDAEYKALKSGDTFRDFHAIIPEIDRLIRPGMSEEVPPGTRLQVIGLSGQHTWEVFKRYITDPADRLKENVKDVRYTIFMVAANGSGAVVSLATAAEERAREIESFKHEHAQQLVDQHIDISYGRYDHLPTFHGTLVNEQHLFLGHTYWTDRGTLYGSTVPHFYFNRNEERLGRPYVEFFDSWWCYLAVNCPQPP
jgi:hypothetical protein